MMHPESSRRLEAIIKRMESTGSLGRFATLQPRHASRDEISLVHGADYVDVVELYSRSERPLDGDTVTSKDSFGAATMAAGAGLAAADAVHAGEVKRALLLVRPPGHHSLPRRAMGFCLFNNVAITARYLQSLGYQRPAILDWDVHHGNGTQDVFYNDPSVLFISLHQFPFYPGTGAAAEQGSGEGKGFTLNLPMSAGSVEPDYRQAFEGPIREKLESFSPDILLISAGFDAHEKDPLASVELQTRSFEWMSNWALDFANQSCDGKIISFLEGGYHLDALAESVEVHATTLLG
ncbi:MAG: histone deacetylase [Leptospiraceae bacterium]|nr:histone deacetylase [Leptospiraceae bacterium]